MKKGYYITVSEPWDFKGPDGLNIIKGHIVEVIDNLNLIYRSNSNIKFDEGEGDTFLLKPRNAKYSDFTYLPHIDVTVNGFLLKGQSYQTDDLEKLALEAKFVMIGAINIEPSNNIFTSWFKR